MEVQCLIPSLGSTSGLHVTVWSAQLISSLNPRERQELKEIIDQMGLLSAKAQGLKASITNFDRMKSGLHRLYLCTHGVPEQAGAVVVKGMLKVGAKNLFMRRQDGSIREISPLCVLDFYVHHTCQRAGLGRLLFETMLSKEGKHAHQLGYDRPSVKLLSLLEKYYGLSRYLPQGNHFVVFDAYFDDTLNSFETRKKNMQDCVIPLSLLEATCWKDSKIQATKAQSETSSKDQSGWQIDPQQMTNRRMNREHSKDEDTASCLSSSSSALSSTSTRFFQKWAARWANAPRSRYHAQLSGVGVAAVLRPGDSSVARR